MQCPEFFAAWRGLDRSACGRREWLRTACRCIPRSLSLLCPVPEPAGGNSGLVFHSPLVGARDVHILPILGDRATSDLDTLRLQNAGDLLVGQRPGGILFLNQFLDPAFEDEERGVGALGSIHAFTEEVA